MGGLGRAGVVVVVVLVRIPELGGVFADVFPLYLNSVVRMPCLVF